MAQSKKEKQLKAWHRLIDQLKETGDLRIYDEAKRLRTLMGTPLAVGYSLFFQEEIAQLCGYIKSANRSHSLTHMSSSVYITIQQQAKKFDTLTVENYRNAVMILWSARMELSNSKCAIGALPYEMHWYEDNYRDLCRLPLNNQHHNFRVRYDIEEGKKNATV